jgi:ribosomal protein S27AE
MPTSKLICPACGFERLEADVCCLMCGVDFRIYPSGTDEPDKKNEPDADEEYGIDISEYVFGDNSSSGYLNSHDGYIDDDHINMSGFAPFPQSELVMEYDDEVRNSISKKNCPNCGYSTLSSEIQCGKCGVVFSFFEAVMNSPFSHSERVGKTAGYTEKIMRLCRFSMSVLISLMKFFFDLAVILTPFIKKTSENLHHYFLENRKKVLITAIVIVAAILLYYPSGRFVAFFNDFIQERKIQAENRAVIETAENFRINACQIRDSIIDKAENAGIEAAMSELAMFDVTVLRYHPFMILLKDRLEEISLKKRLLDIQPDDYESLCSVYKRLAEIAPDDELYPLSYRLNRQTFAAIVASEARAVMEENEGNRNSFPERSLLLAQRAYSIDPSPENEGLVNALKRKRLLFYEDNGHVAMALRDEGFSDIKRTNQRKIRVWLKNVGETPFMVNPDFFFMICEDGVRYSYNDISSNMITELLPGQEVSGDVFFYTKSSPKRLLFEHVRVGSISRFF